MEQFLWDDKLSTEIDEIDSQHKKLIGLINKLAIDKEQEQLSREYIHSLLSELFNYTIYHFFTEEQIMENTNYPEYAAHKTAHINLSSQVVDYFERFSNGEENLLEEIFEFLKDWLFTHIMNIDTKLGTYLKQWQEQD